jgi:sugar phosphate isomerase/epimerase
VGEQLRAYVELSEWMNVRVLRVVPDSAKVEPKPEEIVEVVSAVLPDLQRSGVHLAIENHDRFPARTLHKIVQSLDSEYVGICLDTANSLGCGEGLETVLRELGPWVLNLHVKDFAVTRLSHLKGFTIEGRPAGQGFVDIPKVIQELKRYGRDPNAIIELWPPPQPTWQGSVALEEQWAEQSVHYMRQLIAE